MNFSRRGFLQTLAAAAVGAATFDPTRLLWTPKAPEPLIVGGLTAADVATQLELNEIAMLVARQMTERLARHPSVALREVMFRHGGTVDLPPDLLEIPDVGVGHFAPMATRVMATRQTWTLGPTHSAVEDIAHDLEQKITHAGRAIDMFAPVGVELRTGEPFTEDVQVGVATDPESGLSVRVLRFDMDRAGKRGVATQMTSAEMAGGRWYGRRTSPGVTL